MSKRWAILMLCLCAVPCAVQAQMITASLQGVVEDSSGAIVPGASVRVVNVNTNAATRATSGADGSFLLPSLPAGMYRVEVEATGFKKLERSGVELRVDQAARLVLKVEIGALSESIKITGEAPLLEPTTSSIGQVIDSSSIVNLPLNQRNPFGLIFLAPGVHGGVDRTFNSMNWSSNGGRPGTNEILIDGVPSSPPLATQVQGFSIFPSVDAVQEFKMQTNNYSSEFGRSGGSIVNLLLKSGTNQFHGSLFEFLRNSKMDSNEFFANANNVPLKSFRRNQFGISVGGPVVIPGVYNGRNKTFFYANYEGLREGRVNNMTNATMPTALQRSGDFSQTLNAQGKPITLFDPTTTVLVGGKPTRTAFAGNVIPVSRIDPVAAKVVKYYPLPNGPGNALSGMQNYNVSGSDPINIDQGDIKVDQIVTSSQRLFGRFSRRKFGVGVADLFPAEYRLAQGGSNQNQDSVGSALDYTWTASPTYLLNARLGFSRMHLAYAPLGDGFDPSKQLGFPDYYTANADRLVFPGFNATGYQGIGQAGYDFRRNSFETYNFSLANTKIMSAHMIKFGFEARMLRVHNTETFRPAGQFSFPREFTGGPNPQANPNTAGDGMASMLLGLGSGYLTKGNKTVSTQNPYYGWYIGDDWKVSRRLTLNLGVRYEVELPRTERYNRMTVFDTALVSPIAKEAGLPNLKGGLVYVGINGVPRAQSTTDKNNISPRVGFAYQVSQKMAVRGAYGIFYAPSLMAASGEIGNVGYRSDTPYVGGLDGDVVFPNNYLRNPFPNGFVPALGSSLGARTAVGDNITASMGNSVTPYTQNWNLSIQYELPGGVLLEPSYVAARGVQLNTSSGGDFNLNQLTQEQLNLGGTYLQERVPSPFYGVISPIYSLGSSTTIRRMDLMKAFPQYGTVAQMYRGGSTSIYHSFQLKAEKRFRRGLNFLAAYTNGKQLDDHSALSIVGNDLNHQNIYDRRSDWSISPNDVSQRLVLSYVYELPFGRNRAVGRTWNWFFDAVAGGWQTNGIMSLQRGQPFTILANNNPNFGSPALRANNNGRSAKLEGPVQQRLNKYFNTAVFSQPAAFTFGNVGRTLPDVRVDGARNFDLSMFKNFRVAEGKSFQFRCEAFNAFNTVQFGPAIPGVSNASFGMILGTANTPRQMQLGLKFLF